MEVAIIAPFSNLTIITTNSIPKEKERGDALIVRMIIWRRQQQETSLLSSKSATTDRALSERFLYTAGGRRDEAPACHHFANFVLRDLP